MKKLKKLNKNFRYRLEEFKQFVKEKIKKVMIPLYLKMGE
jgi:hypothetical protein